MNHLLTTASVTIKSSYCSNNKNIFTNDDKLSEKSDDIKIRINHSYHATLLYL